MNTEKNIQFKLEPNTTSEITTRIDSIKSKGLSRILDASYVLRSCLPEGLITALESIGLRSSHHNSIIIHGLFDSKDPDVALLIHEAVSRNLCGINDIKYSYEDHKAIYPRVDGTDSEEWGNGVGHISAHSDDLYENIDSDLLSLTVAHDNTQSPTLVYNTRELINRLQSEDIETLRSALVRYRSGRNVVGTRLERIRPVIEDQDGYELYNIDFRVEKNHGDRMVAVNIEHQPVIDRLRLKLEQVTPVSAEGKTGTFVVINNRKVLHSRAAISQQYGYGDPAESSRLLFRSKGQKVQLNSVSNLY